MITKNKIWAYGCSWTHSIYHEQKYDLRFWPEILSEKIGFDCVNNGLGGQSNFESTVKLFRQMEKIKEGDLVVFEFTYPDRFPVPFVNENPVRESWSSKDIFEINDVLIDFDWHQINYFRSEKFYDEEKMKKYVYFVLDFIIELLILGFKNVLPVFDYLENKIGATVKYWFLNPIHPKDVNSTQKRKENVIKTITHPSRIIYFPLDDDEFNIDAQRFISNECLRYSDRYKNYDTKFWEELVNDHHPNETGQYIIAENILSYLQK